MISKGNNRSSSSTIKNVVALGFSKSSTSRTYLSVVIPSEFSTPMRASPATVSLFSVTLSSAEPGTAGESDTLKKVGYDERISFREQVRCQCADAHHPNAARTYTDRFLVFNSKVLEDRGQYLVITAVRKTFNGHVMISSPFNPSLLLCSLIAPLVLQLSGGDPIPLCCKGNSTIQPIPSIRSPVSLV